MPRTPRVIQPGAVYHLISRFVDRDWYIRDDEERATYLALFGRAVAQSDWGSLAFATMSNHVHHAVVAGEEPLDQWLRRAHAPFADWLNRRYDRIGGIFVRGPKQREVKPGGVAALIAYIHNNPVRAGVVRDVALSGWTSHRAYVGLEPAPRWLDIKRGLKLAGLADGATLDAFVRTAPNDPARRALRDQGVIEDLSRPAAFHVPDPPSIDAAQVVAVTAQVLGFEASMLTMRCRSSSHVFARHVAIVAADRVGLAGARIAQELGITQQSASLTIRRSVPRDVERAAARVIDRLGSARRAGRRTS